MWTTPKVDWKPTDYFNIADFNRIKGNLDHLRDLANSLYSSFMGDYEGNSFRANLVRDGVFNVKSLWAPSVQALGGRNLLPHTLKTTYVVNGVTVTVNSNKTITFNGTSTASIDFYLFGAWGATDTVFTLPKGTYTVKGTANASIEFYMGIGTEAKAHAPNGANKTFTLAADTAIAWAMMRIAPGTTLSNFTVYPQIEIGTVSNGYVQHVPSEPSPSYPVPIIVPSRVDVIGCNKNLALNPSYVAAGNYSMCIFSFAELEPDTTYTISFMLPEGERVYCNENLFTKDVNTPIGTGKRASMIVTTQSVLSKTDGKQYNAQRGWALFKNSAGFTSSGTASQLQIEKGPVMTEYVESKSNKITVAKEFGSIPDGTKNAIEVIGGQLKHVKRLILETLDGSESYGLSVENTNTVMFQSQAKALPPSSNGVDGTILCNKFKTYNASALWTMDVEGITTNTYKYIQIRVIKNRMAGWSDSLTTNEKIALFKGWLASNPIIVQYASPTPIITDVVVPTLNVNRGEDNIVVSDMGVVSGNFYSALSYNDTLANKMVSDYYYANEFNTIEENLVNINKYALNLELGEGDTFVDNGPFIDYEELNRIEQSSEKMYGYFMGQYHGRRRLLFKLGRGQKFNV